MYAGIRLREQTYVYGDPDHPDRPTRVIDSPAYVTEDHALLAGLLAYEDSLCSCGQPKHVAWHADMDGWFESESVKCQACSVVAGRPVIYHVVYDTRPEGDDPLSPFVLGLTTAST